MSKQAAPLLPVYLLIGEQPLLVDQALERLKTRVGEVADLDFNMQSFSAESAPAGDIIAACNTIPFASDHRLVVVKGIEKMPKDMMEALAVYAADPSPTTILALAGEKLAKNTRLYKAVDKLGGVVDRKFEKKDAPAMVRQMFERKGKVLAPGAAEELVSAVGFDLRRLSVEVDKATAYVGTRNEVTLEDVEAVTMTTAPTSVWEFVEALGDRSVPKALATLASLIDEGQSIHSLHALAVRALRDLIATRSLLDRGVTSSQAIASELGRQEWQVRRMVRQAKRFRGDELVALLRGAAASEAQMKTSRDSRLVLERWIVKFCA